MPTNIPGPWTQVMAIATLERCYNNADVITGVVKIRKGEAVKLMMAATNLESVKNIFHQYTAMVCSYSPSTSDTDTSTTSTLSTFVCYFYTYFGRVSLSHLMEKYKTI